MEEIDPILKRIANAEKERKRLKEEIRRLREILKAKKGEK
jgi:hypothetical protein